MNYESIWVASEDKAKSIFKHKVYDYVTDIDIQPDKLVFDQSNLIIFFKDVNTIFLGHQRIAYIAYIIACIPVFFSVYGQSRNIAYATIPLALGAILGICIGYVAQRFVIITFNDGEKLTTLYLADGRIYGWKGIFGGTTALFLKITNAINIWREIQ